MKHQRFLGYEASLKLKQTEQWGIPLRKRISVGASTY